MTPPTPLMILVAGPYRSGTGDDPALNDPRPSAKHSEVLKP